MSNEQLPAIRLLSVSKSYTIYPNPGYRLLDFLGLKRWLKEGRHYRAFWALRDINLEIPVGGKVAFVGRNGAGKSTLLRLISGNTVSTSGIVEVNGHCEALLELGTAFNPEFSGRENIYTALAYQGIIGQAAREKFWEVVDFAELDEFIDQPVRTYSSGMYLRLAFSVATAVTPEILIIDEILAAGDAYFQSKCLARIEELTSGPKTTILFVSHNLDAAQRLCDTFVWIDRGRIMAVGPSMEVRLAYEHSIRRQRQIHLRGRNLKLHRDSLSVLQAANESGVHVLGQFKLDGDGAQAAGPNIEFIRLYAQGTLAEEIRVGDAMDDAEHYPSFIINNADDKCWGPPQQNANHFTRFVQGGQNGANGAKFALFLAHDDFTAADFQLELEVAYQDSSASACYLELSAGQAGLHRLLSLEHAEDNSWKTARAVVPRWIYAPPGSEGDKLPKQGANRRPDYNNKSNNISKVRPEQRFGTGQVLIEKLQLLNEQGEECFVFQHAMPMSVVLTYQTQDETLIGSTMLWTLTVQRVDGVRVIFVMSALQNQVFPIQSRGKLRLRFDSLLLTSGTYWVTTGLFGELNLHGLNQSVTDNAALYDLHRQVYQFTVEGTYPLEAGVVRHPVRWEIVE
jgi:lipopolysaccharide transport system ATP-binding protein